MDLRLSKPFRVGTRNQIEALVEVFNLTGNDNFHDPSYGNLVFNFDGRSAAGWGSTPAPGRDSLVVLAAR